VSIIFNVKAVFEQNWMQNEVNESALFHLLHFLWSFMYGWIS